MYVNYNEKAKKLREEWVSTLQVGDEVAIDAGRWSDYSYKILKVVKITPSGRRNLSDGTVANPNGSLRGDSYEYIYPVTDEIRNQIWRVKTIKHIFNKLGHELNIYSDDKLKKLLEIVDENEGEKDND